MLGLMRNGQMGANMCNGARSLFRAVTRVAVRLLVNKLQASGSVILAPTRDAERLIGGQASRPELSIRLTAG